METGKGARGHRSTQNPKTFLLSLFLFSIFLLLAGCASPGEPIERRPLTPAAITDLAAQQSGNTVVLSFTLPRETIQHRPLKQPPSIEVLRSFSAASSTSTPAPAEAHTPPSLIITIPSAMVDHYTQQGHIRYVDVLQPADFSQLPNEVAIYTIVTRASEKRASPPSNVASLPIFPLPDPIDDLRAQIVRAGAGVTLTWTPPQKTPVGPAPAIETYRIYRVEIPTQGQEGKQAAPAAQQPASPANPIKLKQEFEQIAETSSPQYEDAHTEFGKTYTYSVRSVVQNSGQQFESSDSKLAKITMRDIYPPSAPQGLVAVFVPKLGDNPAHLELSWAINPETDVAGYNVYRSEQQGTLGTRLNPELLLTPAFRDTSAVAGRNYFYAVTAVDRSGNESSPSAPIASEMPAESQ